VSQTAFETFEAKKRREEEKQSFLLFNYFREIGSTRPQQRVYRLKCRKLIFAVKIAFKKCTEMC
jgi:hypothetical protein